MLLYRIPHLFVNVFKEKVMFLLNLCEFIELSFLSLCIVNDGKK